MEKQELKPGSKLDKAVKLLKAQNALADLAPAGGMDPEVLAMHDVLSKRFDAIAESCGITEHSLILLCKTAMGE